MRVDYDAISLKYDKYRRGGGPYLVRLAELASECLKKSPSQTILEIGAGTGNNTQALLEVCPCHVVALDQSSGMLKQAKAKGMAADFVQGSATQFPLADQSVSFVFGVYLLHHLNDVVSMFNECARVLDHGAMAFVTASRDFIGRHPMNQYFPSFSAVDQARFQAIDDLVLCAERAGFRQIHVEQFVDAPRPIGLEYVEKVANKFISTYDLIPQQEYEEGLCRLREDVARTGQLEIEMIWESVVVSGIQSWDG